MGFYHRRETRTKQKDAPIEDIGPAPLALFWPLHNRRMGGVETGRRCARFHRRRRAGRQRVHILPRRSLEKGAGGSLLLSQIIHETFIPNHSRASALSRRMNSPKTSS